MCLGPYLSHCSFLADSAARSPDDSGAIVGLTALLLTPGLLLLVGFGRTREKKRAIHTYGTYGSATTYVPTGEMWRGSWTAGLVGATV